MAPPRLRTINNIFVELRKTCQHPFLSAPELENEDISPAEQHKQLISASGKLQFLKILLSKLKARGHRVLLFSQFKIALDFVEDFVAEEGYKYLRLDGNVKQAKRQKDMDEFNAPGSEVFLYLLTTRAGGVGVNLATADTVIVFDPDLNPHMDLQAISRSHRYGQHKRVLVFKLMVKSSVEERIIWLGRKKMLLDHLVVQQMGKETEEGDIDSMLVHGAEALYSADEQGHSASDIVYTDRDVEEMIEKVEAEAEVEAKRLNERYRAIDNGEISTSGAETEKDEEVEKRKMNFSFAKVWETTGHLEEIPADDEDEGEEGWRLVFEHAQKERERKRLEEEERGPYYRAAADKAKQRHLNNLNMDVDQAAPSPSQDGQEPSQEQGKKKRGPYKKKGKVIQNLASDPEGNFDPTLVREDTSEEEVGAFDEVPDLGAPQAGPSRGYILGDTQKLSKKARKQMELARAEYLRQEAVAAQEQGAVAGPSTVPSTAIAGPASVPPAMTNGASLQLRTAPVTDRTAGERNQDERSRVVKVWKGAIAYNLAISKSLTSAPPKLPPGTVIPSEDHVKDYRMIERGELTVRWMGQLFANMNLIKHRLDHARLLSLQLKDEERIALYCHLAVFLDELLQQIGQPVHFLKKKQLPSVVAWIRNRSAFMPRVQLPFLQADRTPGLVANTAQRSPNPAAGALVATDRATTATTGGPALLSAQQGAPVLPTMVRDVSSLSRFTAPSSRFPLLTTAPQVPQPSGAGTPTYQSTVTQTAQPPRPSPQAVAIANQTVTAPSNAAVRPNIAQNHSVPTVDRPSPSAARIPAAIGHLLAQAAQRTSKDPALVPAANRTTERPTFDTQPVVSSEQALPASTSGATASTPAQGPAANKQTVRSATAEASNRLLSDTSTTVTATTTQPSVMLIDTILNDERTVQRHQRALEAVRASAAAQPATVVRSPVSAAPQESPVRSQELPVRPQESLVRPQELPVRHLPTPDQSPPLASPVPVVVEPAIPTPVTAGPPASQERAGGPSAAPRCSFCRERHFLRDCPSIPKAEVLAGFRRSIASSDEPDEVKRESYAAIDKLMRLHQAAGTAGSDAEDEDAAERGKRERKAALMTRPSARSVRAALRSPATKRQPAPSTARETSPAPSVSSSRAGRAEQQRPQVEAGPAGSQVEAGPAGPVRATIRSPATKRRPAPSTAREVSPAPSVSSARAGRAEKPRPQVEAGPAGPVRATVVSPATTRRPAPSTAEAASPTLSTGRAEKPRPPQLEAGPAGPIRATAGSSATKRRPAPSTARVALPALSSLLSRKDRVEKPWSQGVEKTTSQSEAGSAAGKKRPRLSNIGRYAMTLAGASDADEFGDEKEDGPPPAKRAKESTPEREETPASSPDEMFSPIPICAFCTKQCGQSIRECAGNHGGRKELKTLIRRLDSEPEQKARADQLFECYQSWPNPKR